MFLLLHVRQTVFRFRPWFIDAANINGTAQLHLLAHNAIKSLRALKLTERFIGSKQFTTDPPNRMLKWLLVNIQPVPFCFIYFVLFHLIMLTCLMKFECHPV